MYAHYPFHGPWLSQISFEWFDVIGCLNAWNNCGCNWLPFELVNLQNAEIATVKNGNKRYHHLDGSLQWTLTFIASPICIISGIVGIRIIPAAFITAVSGWRRGPIRGTTVTTCVTTSPNSTLRIGGAVTAVYTVGSFSSPWQTPPWIARGISSERTIVIIIIIIRTISRCSASCCTVPMKMTMMRGAPSHRRVCGWISCCLEPGWFCGGQKGKGGTQRRLSTRAKQVSVVGGLNPPAAMHVDRRVPWYTYVCIRKWWWHGSIEDWSETTEGRMAMYRRGSINTTSIASPRHTKPTWSSLFTYIHGQLIFRIGFARIFTCFGIIAVVSLALWLVKQLSFLKRGKR